MTDYISRADAPVEAIGIRVYNNAFKNWTWDISLPKGGSIHANKDYSYEWEAQDDAHRAARAWMMQQIRKNRTAGNLLQAAARSAA